LVKAFALVRAELPQARLVIAGTPHFGPASLAIKQLIDKLGLERQVIALDEVPDADLPQLYNCANVFVLPSLYEGFGLPALEAMACGVPVIVADATSLPEVVGEAGLLFDPQDEHALARHLLAVLGHDDMRAQLSQRSRMQAQVFSLERQAKETLWAYQRAIDLVC
jgi:glycosyltransferase involved in cell wall biosynthesis